jgi:diaminohydroxyphosphoribosylaminopyrimidine deaminase/5-amino-6-(5-phosphoribosylamino)uracil reductase
VKRPFYRVVFDTRLRLPPTSRLARSARRAPVIVLARRAGARGRARLERLGVTVILVEGGGGRVPVAGALRALHAHGLRSLMVEGGSELLGSFVAEGLYDQLALFRAPRLLGGRGALPAFGGPDRARLADAARLGLRPPPEPTPAAAAGAGPAYELWYRR